MNSRHGYAHLDGVRGWAALMVVYSHFIFAMHPAMLGAGAERSHFDGAAWFGGSGLIVLYNSQLAVDVFFVLSGFVLASSVNVRPAPFIELAVRRWVRLGLPILGATALIWPLVHFHLFYTDTAGALAKSNWLVAFYNWNNLAEYPDLDLVRLFWRSLVVVFVSGHGCCIYDPVLWTMRMEFWGSIGLYFGYCVLPRRFIGRGGGLPAALVAAAFAWNTPLLASFTYGIVLFELARLVARQPEPRRAAWAGAAAPAAIALLAAGVVLGGIPYGADLSKPDLYGRLFLALAPWVEVPQFAADRVAAFCLVAATLLWWPLQIVLLTRMSQWLGRVSLMLYLVHVPILCSLGAWLLLRLEPPLGYNAATLVVLPVFLAAALGTAALTTWCIDAPAIRLARRVGAAVGGWWRRGRDLLMEVAGMQRAVEQRPGGAVAELHRGRDAAAD